MSERIYTRTVKCQGAKSEDEKINVIFDFTGVSDEQVKAEAVGQLARNLYNNTSPNSSDKDGRIATKKVKRTKMLAEVEDKGSYTLKVSEFLSGGGASVQLSAEETIKVIDNTTDEGVAKLKELQELIAVQIKAQKKA